MKKWVCKVCGYVYEGPEAPAECPVCHAPAKMFEEVAGEIKLAAEHEYGIYAKTVKNNPEDVYKRQAPWRPHPHPAGGTWSARYTSRSSCPR